MKIRSLIIIVVQPAARKVQFERISPMHEATITTNGLPCLEKSPRSPIADQRTLDLRFRFCSLERGADERDGQTAEGQKNRGWRDEWPAGFKLPSLLFDKQTCRGCSIAIHSMRSTKSSRGRGLFATCAVWRQPVQQERAVSLIRFTSPFSPLSLLSFGFRPDCFSSSSCAGCFRCLDLPPAVWRFKEDNLR